VFVAGGVGAGAATAGVAGAGAGAGAATGAGAADAAGVAGALLAADAAGAVVELPACGAGAPAVTVGTVPWMAAFSFLLSVPRALRVAAPFCAASALLAAVRTGVFAGVKPN
jgi:hypothetical protein